MRRQSSHQPLLPRRRPAFLTVIGVVLAIFALAIALFFQQTRDVHLMLAVAREEGAALVVATRSVSQLALAAVFAAFATTFLIAKLASHVRRRVQAGRALRALLAEREAELADLRKRLASQAISPPPAIEPVAAEQPTTSAAVDRPSGTGAPANVETLRTPCRNGPQLDAARLGELRAMFSPADLHEFISRFLDATGRRIDRIAALAEGGDRTELGQEAQVLVGSAISVGALRLAGLAAELAAACRDGLRLEELAARLDTEAVGTARALRCWLEKLLVAAA